MDSPGNLFLFSVFLLPLFFSYSNSYKFYAGGRDGWVLKPSEDYNHWAGRNRFQVNDTIYFKYEKGSDSVLVVNKQDYETCNTKSPIKKFEDGNSEFKFDRSGPFYFISGVDDRCKNGQKLIVVVLAIRPIRRPPVLPPKASPPYPVSQPPSVFPSPPSYSPPTAQPPQTHYPAPSASPTSPSSGSPSPTAITPVSSSPAPSASPVSPSYSPSTSPSPSEGTPSSSSPAPSTSPVSPSASPPTPEASSPSSTGNPPSPSSPAGAETTPAQGGPGGSADTTAVPPPGSNRSTANSLMVLSVTTAISVAFGCFLAVY